MTEAEKACGTARLEELERLNALNEESLNALRKWWRKVLRRESEKIVNLDEYRKAVGK